MGLLGPSLEKTFRFPLDPDASQHSRARFRVGGLYAAFDELGELTLSVLGRQDHLEAARAAEFTMLCLEGLTRFIEKRIGPGWSRPLAFSQGRHTYACDLRDNRPARRQLAGSVGMDLSGATIIKATIGYESRYDRERLPIDTVDMSVEFEGHPKYRALYARLSGRDDTYMGGPQSTAELRAAQGYVYHEYLLKPDIDPGFDYLAALGAAFGRLPRSPGV